MEKKIFSLIWSKDDEVMNGNKKKAIEEAHKMRIIRLNYFHVRKL